MAFFHGLLQMTYARKINSFPTGMNKWYQLIWSHLLGYSWQLIQLQISYVKDIKIPELATCKTILFQYISTDTAASTNWLGRSKKTGKEETG